MDKIANLEAARQEKIPRCDYCGEPEHKAIFSCRRIKSITYTDDDQVIIRLWGDKEHRDITR